MTEPQSAHIARLKAEALAAQAEAAAAKAAAAQAALDAALAASSDVSDAQAVGSDTEPAELSAGSVAVDEPLNVDSYINHEPVTQDSSQASTEHQTSNESHSQNSYAVLGDYAREVKTRYMPSKPSVTLGCFIDGEAPVPGVTINVPLGMFNRHGIIAGATGTGKTRTLQLIAEGLSNAEVPVFLTDIKGDLTGLCESGTASPQLLERTSAQGQTWEAGNFPLQFFTLGGLGQGIPIRTTVTDLGPILMAKVLGLNETQEAALALMFHWADQNNLALIDLGDLRSLITYLTSDTGKTILRDIGGIAPATAGVILREIAQLQTQGGDEFFGEPSFDVHDFLTLATDGRGVISCLELPDVQSIPALFSTFTMWLLTELFQILPEAGDLEKPKLVFFFDEAHLLFNNATPEFLNQVVQTVRLIRSRGVGIFFVTQTPKDIPADVLAQLGAKVQHALRAHTPKDAQALKETIQTFPLSPLDLASILPALGTGEAVVTFLDSKGRPSPVAPTRIFAPASVMGTARDTSIKATIAASPLVAKYSNKVDPESATEILDARIAQENSEREARIAREAEEKAAAKERERQLRDMEKQLEAERKAEAKAEAEAMKKAEREEERARKRRQDTVDAIVRTAGRTITSSIVRSIFGTRRR